MRKLWTKEGWTASAVWNTPTHENWQEEEGRISQIVVQYFGALYAYAQPRRVQEVLDYVPSRLTSEDNLELLKPNSEDQVKQVVFQIQPRNPLVQMDLLGAFSRTTGMSSEMI